MKNADKQQKIKEPDLAPALTTATLNTKKIITYRKNNRLTQKDLAEKMEVTTVAIARWEKNKNLPSKANLRKMAKIMDVEITELMILPNAKMNYLQQCEENERLYCQEDSKKIRAQILSLLYEANSLITESVHLIKKDSELTILESILNNALILVRTQKQEQKGEEKT